MTPLSAILNELRDRGFVDDFELVGSKLLSKQTGKLFSSDEIVIERFYRFEGDSSADDMAVLYAVRTSSGTMGTIIDAYGVYDNDELADFLRDVKVINNN